MASKSVQKDQLLFIICNFLYKSDISLLLSVSKPWRETVLNLEYLWQTFSIRHDIHSPDFSSMTHHTNISFLKVLPIYTKNFIVTLHLDLFLLYSTHYEQTIFALNCNHKLSCIGCLPNLKSLSIFVSHWSRAPMSNQHIMQQYKGLCDDLHGKHQSVYNVMYENNTYSEYDDFDGLLQDEFELFLGLNPSIEHLEGIFTIFKANEHLLNSIKSAVVYSNISSFISKKVGNRLSFISSTFQDVFDHPQYFGNLKHMDVCMDSKYRTNIIIRLLQQLVEYNINIEAICVSDWNGILNDNTVIDAFVSYISTNCVLEWINIEQAKGINDQESAKYWQYQCINFLNVTLTFNQRLKWLHSYCPYGIQHDVVANFMKWKCLQNADDSAI
eukprot:13081_1